MRETSAKVIKRGLVAQYAQQQQQIPFAPLPLSALALSL
jgi:hypothetical protein